MQIQVFLHLMPYRPIASTR